MTEDFKIYTKDYIAGSVVPEEESGAELFYGQYVGSTNIYENYDYNAVIKCVKQVVSPKNVGVMWTILALWSDTLHKGRFVILDENNHVVSIIDQYTSEVDIGCYYCIDLDEKGRLYGIEWFNQERVRFIMLNNISVPRGDEYYADIRKTYNIPDIIQNSYTYSPLQNSKCVGEIKKSGSKYGIYTYVDESGGDIIAYSLDIDVENGNTWKGAYTTSTLWKPRKPYILVDENNYFIFKVLLFSSDINTACKRDILKENQFDISDYYVAGFINTNGLNAVEDSNYYWINENNILIPYYDENKLYLQTLDISILSNNNNTVTCNKVYEENYCTQQLQVKFNSVNNYCFMYALGINDINNVNFGWKESIYHIFSPLFSYVTQSDNIFEKVLNDDTNVPQYDNVEYFLIQNQYNLYNHTITHKGEDELQIPALISFTYQEIYNENNYNGAPYYSNIRSSCVPQQFILKNGDKIYYARDIYNKTAYGNIVDVSLQIPNNLVNDVEINNEQLWGIFKIVMNNENKVITKNKYEELILTIRNKLNIIDNNDGQNTLLPEISERVGKCMAEILPIAYGGVHIKYAKINYHDTTTENIAVTTSRTDNVTTISFSISVSKKIDSIDLISKLGYKYITITPTLEIGKTYTISQDVRIGD